MIFKRGLKPPRPGAVKMTFGTYFKPAELPKRPAEFGHENLVTEWHMLGNADYSCCAFSGAAHETYLWTASGSQRAHITTFDVLSDYGACTGFDPRDPETDQGSDLQEVASYRKKIGILDAVGNRHKIGAYVSLKPGDVDQILNAAWLFGAVGLGVTIGSRQEEQFATHQPWAGPVGEKSGGHYVPLVCNRGLPKVVTWGGLQPMTLTFLEEQCDQAIAYLSPDMLRSGKSLEGFDLAALQDDLNQLT